MIPSLLLCETRFRAGAQARRQPEVTGAVRGDADGAAVADQDWGYFYDAIGNRSSSTRAGRAVICEPNALTSDYLQGIPTLATSKLEPLKGKLPAKR